ncbi:UNVERIFIED_CONTAM: hypothetical protein Slati_0420600 [Sesamum latifolium]|uniref:Uncharacterized protein n=1 Tax=Sesamum latifolium TaxID=2727402 RepID=A0AAW2XXQ1_9LAMI
MPKAVYTLTREQKRRICEWITHLKFPDGYASNLAHCVDMKELRLQGMKSHDYHVFIQKLILIVFREMLPELVWSALTEVSLLVQILCSTMLDVNKVLCKRNRPSRNDDLAMNDTHMNIYVNRCFLNEHYEHYQSEDPIIEELVATQFKNWFKRRSRPASSGGHQTLPHWGSSLSIPPPPTTPSSVAPQTPDDVGPSSASPAPEEAGQQFALPTVAPAPAPPPSARQYISFVDARSPTGVTVTMSPCSESSTYSSESTSGRPSRLLGPAWSDHYGWPTRSGSSYRRIGPARASSKSPRRLSEPDCEPDRVLNCVLRGILLCRYAQEEVGGRARPPKQMEVFEPVQEEGGQRLEQAEGGGDVPKADGGSSALADG